MPVPMPFYLEKGPFFAVFEDYFNSGDQARLVDSLRKLRNGDGLETFDLFASPSLQVPGRRQKVDWSAHLNEHWFGMTKQPDGSWKQAPFDPDTNAETGYWLGYYGDVDTIARTTIMRALEVALGVDHVADPAAAIVPTRKWKIEFLWKCSQAWFEGWVTWRRHGPASEQGQVTVIWATPPVTGSIVLDSPLKGDKKADYRENPTSTRVAGSGGAKEVDAAQGMWVVTHAHNTAYTGTSWTTTLASLLGQWLSPLPGRISATGEVVTVAPSMADGGVLADGLPYVDPTP